MEERLSRFVLSRNAKHISRENNVVKPKAFMPDKRGELSVFETESLDEVAIWQLGVQYVADPQGQEVIARGDLPGASFLKEKLQIRSDAPPPYHAVVVGWPKETHEQRLIAQRLSRDSQIRYPS